MKTKFQQWEDLIPEAITVNSEIISTQNEFQIAVVKWYAKQNANIINPK